VLDDAEKTATRVQIRNLEVALDTYRMNHSRYPTSDEGLVILLNPPGRDRGYIDVIPKDSWNNDFVYVYPGQRGEFDLYSLGRDGQEGGEGLDADIGNWATE
jgi:general secretion pathway protein G